jgi:hypothetical protein
MDFGLGAVCQRELLRSCTTPSSSAAVIDDDYGNQSKFHTPPSGFARNTLDYSAPYGLLVLFVGIGTKTFRG